MRNAAHKFIKLRNRHFLLIDLLILCITPLLALLLRLETPQRVMPYLPQLVGYMLAAVVVRLLIFQFFGLYRRYWRYAGPPELALILFAFGVATLVTTGGFLALRLATDWLTLPRSLPIIDNLLALLLVTGNRASLRLIEQWLGNGTASNAPLRVAIVGAGRTGELMAREIQQNSALNWQVVAFLDDDPDKHGVQIRGVPVVGGQAALPGLVRRLGIDRLIIAMPNARGQTVRQLVSLCRDLGVQTQIVPALHELLNGAVSVSRLRNVQIEDLLRRIPIQTDTAAVSELLRGKRVLITGGGGSIGSELCRQILRCQPAQILVLGHGENSVFEITNELQRLQTEAQLAGHTGTVAIIPLIADLRFPERLTQLFRLHRPQIVFHAAAHKHVPLMEAHPAEAVLNNVDGTANVLAAAEAVNVEHFVMISSDKAVNPTSVMGATKRVAEFLVYQAAQRTGRAYQVVRFGNVLGSRGSVLHTFRQQIARGGPVTVTHPDMVRYFMTIPEAVQLVLQASVLGRGGEVFMLDMGEPICIADLARDLIHLSGLQVGRDIEIAYSGLRPGEKLFEEMFTAAEIYTRTHHEKILIAADACRSVPAALDEWLAALTTSARRGDAIAVNRWLRTLVPEYRPAILESGESALLQPPADGALRSNATGRPALQPASVMGD
jgi:FlaA1/EpsC-like NDP-sugar epimerase